MAERRDPLSSGWDSGGAGLRLARLGERPGAASIWLRPGPSHTLAPPSQPLERSPSETFNLCSILPGTARAPVVLARAHAGLRTPLAERRAAGACSGSAERCCRRRKGRNAQLASEILAVWSRPGAARAARCGSRRVIGAHAGDSGCLVTFARFTLSLSS